MILANGSYHGTVGGHYYCFVGALGASGPVIQELVEILNTSFTQRSSKDIRFTFPNLAESASLARVKNSDP